MWPVVVGLVDYRHGCLNIRDMNTIDVMDVIAESMIDKGLIYCDLIAPWNSWKASRHG